MKVKPINKYWRPKLKHALVILLAITISFISGYAFANQEMVAAIGTILTFSYAILKIWNSFFKGRATDV